MKTYNVQEEKAKLKQGEHDNFPKGAERTTHKFVKDKKLRNNEEMFRLADDEIVIGPVRTANALTQPAQCCRLAFHMDKRKIATIFKVHGEGIEYFSGWDSDPEESGQIDPEFGYQMQKPDEGYPCTELLPNGRCKHHKPNETDMESEKPFVCKLFPSMPHHLDRISVCSYTFDENGVRSGTCDGCKGKLGL